MTDIEPTLLRSATGYLLALAFDRPHPAAAPADPDWRAAFREASGIHGLGPYLGHRLERSDLDVPAPLDSWLREQASRNRERLARMHAELLTVLKSLVDAKLPPTPLKGAALLLASPDTLAWRSMSDLDLLVSKGSDRSLDLALARAGYCLHSTSWKHRRYTSCAPGPPLVINDGEHPANPRDIEIHVGVVEMFRGFRWDITPMLLANQVPSPVPGINLPNDDGMSLHLAIHASVALLENSSRAIHLIDLARALDRSGIDPLICAARAVGIETHARFLYPALAFAARETSNARCREAACLLSPFVTHALRAWSATTPLYNVSWAGRNDRAILDRATLWANTPSDHARMLAHTLFASPDQLEGTNGVGSRRSATPRRYLRHYHHLLRRVI